MPLLMLRGLRFNCPSEIPTRNTQEKKYIILKPYSQSKKKKKTAYNSVYLYGTNL